MCQLSFIHIPGDNDLEKTLLSVQFLINSRITHTDGWGYYTNNKLFKSKLNASLTSNLGDLINKDIIGDEPIIAHVRAASAGTKVKRENSHPFETKDFILAHNGTLGFRRKEFEEEWEKLGEKENKYKEMIDSEIFVNVLQQDYTANPDKTFPVIIKDTMEKFFGKFAFLVYVKPENTFYVVRGRSATLWASQVLIKEKAVGILINTEKSDLERSMDLVKQASDALKKNDLDFSEPEAVDAEKTFIYVQDTFELIEMEEISQNYTAITTTKTAGRQGFNNYDHYYNSRDSRHVNRGMHGIYYDDDYMNLDDDEFTKDIETISTFMNIVGFGTKDLERICHYVFGNSLLEMADAEWEILSNDVIPSLKLFYTPHKGSLWSNFCNEGLVYKFYNLKDVQYPYFLNEPTVLTNKFAELVKEREDSKAKPL